MTELYLLFLKKLFCNFIKTQIYKRLSNPQYGDQYVIRDPFKDADAQCRDISRRDISTVPAPWNSWSILLQYLSCSLIDY